MLFFKSRLRWYISAVNRFQLMGITYCHTWHWLESMYMKVLLTSDLSYSVPRNAWLKDIMRKPICRWWPSMVIIGCIHEGNHKSLWAPYPNSPKLSCTNPTDSSQPLDTSLAKFCWQNDWLVECTVECRQTLLLQLVRGTVGYPLSSPINLAAMINIPLSNNHDIILLSSCL